MAFRPLCFEVLPWNHERAGMTTKHRPAVGSKGSNVSRLLGSRQSNVVNVVLLTTGPGKQCAWAAKPSLYLLLRIHKLFKKLMTIPGYAG